MPAFNPVEIPSRELWEQLTFTLSEVLDAHGVCAAVASEVAQYTETTTVVAVFNSPKRLFDVWICQPDGSMEQTRWEAAQESFDTLTGAGSALYQDKFHVPAGEQIKSELWHLARQAVLGVALPFPSNNFTPQGALCLIDPGEDGPLIPRQLESLAMHVTTFLDRAYLRYKSVQQEIEFAIVSDISYALTASLNLENIYQQVRDPIRRTLNVESISIGLMDPLSNEIVFIPTLMGPLFKDLPPIRLEMGQGIAGYVAERAEPVFVNQAYDDHRFYSRIDAISGFETNSILCVPLLVEKRVIGVLEAVNKRDGDFNRQDQRLLQAISGPLAVAIENARLHNDVVGEKRRIETMFASMSEGILTVNRAGLITASNEALGTILLRRQHEPLLGLPAETVIRTMPGDFTEFMNLVFRQEVPYPQLACDLYQRNGSRVPVLISGTVIEDVGGHISEAIFVFSDLRQIREVERMRDDFFQNIIHELRTPLATILMYARLLREGKTNGDKAKADRFLGVIERESDRLQRMVRQMLDLVKLEAREIQRSSAPIFLNLLLEELLPPLADRATEKGLMFVDDVAQKLPPVIGNEETLYMIFKNLVENAIKFTLAGSVRVTVRQEGEFVVASVEDEGIGIPEQGLPNLFKRFYRASTAVERGIAGTGLGLYMVKEGVSKHGGTIAVASKVGKGTSFTVKLPVARI